MGPILFFGAAGQIGCAFMSHARAMKLEARGLTHAEADIISFDAIQEAILRTKPRLIVNAAAYTAVDQAEREPDIAMSVNAVGAENVARAAARLRVPVLHISTDYVFDGSKSEPYTEDDVVAPLGVYGRSKARGELLVLAASKDAIILRTAWVFGPYGNNFLKTILHLTASQDRLRVVADQHGCPTSTADIAEAIVAIDNALCKGRPASGVYHFAGSGTTNWHGFAQAIVDYQAVWTGKRPFVEAITTADYLTPARRPANSKLDSALFERTFGYRAKPWRERMQETIELLMDGRSAQHRMADER
jgi:dTDP-4-dehydrorhamnose reductase